jgi:integrase/recombinase XerD
MSLEKSLNEMFDKFVNAKEKVANRAPDTIEWYQRQIRPWLTWLVAQAGDDDWLEPDGLEDYLGECAETLSPRTVFARYSAVRIFLRWLKRRRLIVGDLPTELIEVPSTGDHKPRVAEIATVDAVIRTAWQGADNWLDYRDVLLIQTMRSCGLRVAELTALRIYHVDLRDGFLLVEGGKGDKDRVVPFDEAFRKAFTAYQFNRPHHDAEWLFLGANGHRQPTGQMTVQPAQCPPCVRHRTSQ